MYCVQRVKWRSTVWSCQNRHSTAGVKAIVPVPLIDTDMDSDLSKLDHF